MLRCSLHKSLASTCCDGELGGPWPILFSAETRNSYSLSSTRSVIVQVRSTTSSGRARTQRELLVTLRSTTYPVTGEPPSDPGGCHDSTTDSLQVSLSSGASGAPGLSASTARLVKQTWKRAG